MMQTECVEWGKYRQPHGYGVTCRAGRLMLAHRAAWEDRHGPIPEGHVVHHVCRNRACVNVDHLQAMPASDHARLHAPTEATRRAGAAASARVREARTHCPQGHEYTPENTYRYPNGRTCRRCAIERTQARRRAAA